MNNQSTMAITLEKKHQQQAALITLLFLALAIVLMFFLKWELPTFEKPIAQAPLEVEISLEDIPPAPAFGGGGGGGNPVQASGNPGVAPAVPSTPGSGEEEPTIEDNPVKSAPVIKTSPSVHKTDNPKPSPSPTNDKTEPKKIDNPAPAKPKATIGKTTSGTGTGGNNAADNYERSGGSGTGTGVGNGSGSGGGTGTGTGGGNGSGTGTGSGPSKISGSRYLVQTKPMNAGENIQGRLEVEISVAPNGVGTFIKARKGSLMNNPQAIAIVKEWLRNNLFNQSKETTKEVYDFNIRIGG